MGTILVNGAFILRNTFGISHRLFLTLLMELSIERMIGLIGFLGEQASQVVNQLIIYMIKLSRSPSKIGKRKIYKLAHCKRIG